MFILTYSVEAEYRAQQIAREIGAHMSELEADHGGGHCAELHGMWHAKGVCSNYAYAGKMPNA